MDNEELRKIIFRMRAQEQELRNEVEDLNKRHQHKFRIYVDLKTDRLALEKAYFVLTGEQP